MLQSASFLGPIPAAAIHVRLVSPQSFPHLWKKLWKIAALHRSPSIRGRKIEVFAAIGPGKLEISRFPVGRKVGEVNLWDDILARIETKVNRHSFYT